LSSRGVEVEVPRHAFAFAERIDEHLSAASGVRQIVIPEVHVQQIIATTIS
jgi:hypothetical protein